MNDWAGFDEQTERDAGLWKAYLELWRLEVVSARCAWQLWPNDATRSAYVRALAERERCEATVHALAELRPVVERQGPMPD